VSWCCHGSRLVDAFCGVPPSLIAGDASTTPDPARAGERAATNRGLWTRFVGCGNAGVAIRDRNPDLLEASCWAGVNADLT